MTGSAELFTSFRQLYQSLGVFYRHVLILGLVGLVYWVSDAFFITPLWNEYKQVSSAIEKAKLEGEKHAKEMKVLKDQLGIDPALSIKEKIHVLEKLVKDMDNDIRHAGAGYIEPDEMVGYISEITKSTKGIKLISIKKLAISEAKSEDEYAIDGNNESQVDDENDSLSPFIRANPIIANALKANSPQSGKSAAKGDNEAVDDAVYKHTVEIKVEGGYRDFVNYIQALEKKTVRALWQSVHIDASQYPESKLTMEVYTYGLQKAWLTL